MNRMTKSNVKRIGLYACILMLVTIALFPLFWIVLSSFKMPVDISSSHPVWIFAPTLRNYSIVLFESDFLRNLLNSTILATVSVAIVMVIGPLAGYSLSRFKIKHKESFFFFVLTTRMGPAVIFALPLYLLFGDFGLLDTYQGMILVYILYNLAFCIWMCRGFFDEIPVEFEESAMVDGHSRLGAFRRITLPLATRGLIATAIICFILTWNEFFYSMILTRFFAKTFTVGLTGYVGVPRIQWELMTAASTIAVLVPILFAILARKYIIRGLTFGAIK